ncbi:hypothetical protein [Methylogaea oryzae]|uniref:hypothetical protein n=1 Tax=Methylogaea oryzae TaxID=1295382 RepID=UPI0012E17943|nr:hypothetical protein [Methylogaea oryzae]
MGVLDVRFGKIGFLQQSVVLRFVDRAVLHQHVQQFFIGGGCAGRKDQGRGAQGCARTQAQFLIRFHQNRLPFEALSVIKINGA